MDWKTHLCRALRRQKVSHCFIFINVHFLYIGNCCVFLGCSEPAEKSDRKQSIFSQLSYDQLKDAISVWLKSATHPDDFDVQMLGEYFRELAVDRKIEVLHPLVNFLHR